MAYVGFSKLASLLDKKKKVRSPGGVAASIGRKKYSKAKFQAYAAKGKKMRGVSPA